MPELARSWLVLTDVDAIQSYLFASVRLAMIAGASQLVAEFDGKVNALAEKKYRGEVLVHAGGIGAALFFTEEDAKGFAAEVEKEFREWSVSGHLTASVPERLGTDPKAEDAVAKAKAALRRRKNEGFAPGEVLTNPLAVRCGSCGREPAVVSRPVATPRGDEPRLLGESCARKLDRRNEGTKDRRRQETWLDLLRAPDPGHPDEDWSDLDVRHLASDFDKLAGDGDLGLVVADGDGIGRLLDQLDPRTQWRTFSQGLEGLFQHSLRRALRVVLGPCRTRVLNREQPLPVQVLFRGGDDIVVACRGDLALPLAAELVLSVSGATDWSWTGPEPKRVGLSAGVVVTRVGFPFRTAHRIAEGLLREAKRTAQEEGWRGHGHGAIDYAVISESFADLDVILAQRFVSTPDRPRAIALTGRPYRAASSGRRSIGSLRDAAIHLAEAGFPRSRLFDLRRELTAEVFGAGDRPLSEAHDTEPALDHFRAWLSVWTDRTCRNPEIRHAWENTRTVLGVEDGGWFNQDADEEAAMAAGARDPERETNARTPLGDLAEAMMLWELDS
jgi:hypothetical protein